jgi:hypothetical protein
MKWGRLAIAVINTFLELSYPEYRQPYTKVEVTQARTRATCIRLRVPQPTEWQPIGD